jgi:anaphase-promoting complex subunit 2
MEIDHPLSSFESVIINAHQFLDLREDQLNKIFSTFEGLEPFHQLLQDWKTLDMRGFDEQVRTILAIRTKEYGNVSSLLEKMMSGSGTAEKSLLMNEAIQVSLELGWEPELTDVLSEYIAKEVDRHISRLSNIFTYTLHLLKSACEEIRSEIVSWNYKASLFVDLLEKNIHQALGNSLVEKMFDVILDFPETKPAISDLSDCIAKCPELKALLETTFKNELQAKIVHCSKSTDGILLIYINLTKVMKMLFPTMEVLESISDPLKKELRKRSDTFKCIIKTIAEDGELYALLDIKQKSVKEQDEFSSDEDELGAFEWHPIPRSALRNVISALNKRSDIVSMLINIYGSQEQFMEEYRTHLSKKLVKNTGFDVVTEIKDLEMLKKRFGEANLHKCEVMIQDVLSSKRINSIIHEKDSKKLFLPLKQLDFLIISSYFWPIEEQNYKFDLPEKLKQSFKDYSEKYSVVKASRKLRFHEQLGSVSLSLEFENGNRTWNDVSPLHAAIIALFDGEEACKSSEELSAALGISSHHLRKEISFWETRGVLVRTKVADEFYYHAVKLLP